MADPYEATVTVGQHKTVVLHNGVEVQFGHCSGTIVAWIDGVKHVLIRDGSWRLRSDFGVVPTVREEVPTDG